MPIKKRFLRNDKLPETDNSIKPRNFFSWTRLNKSTRSAQGKFLIGCF